MATYWMLEGAVLCVQTGRDSRFLQNPYPFSDVSPTNSFCVTVLRVAFVVGFTVRTISCGFIIFVFRAELNRCGIGVT